MTLAPIRPPFPLGARGHQLRWNQDAGAPEWEERPPFDVREYGPWEQGTSAGVVAANESTLQAAVDEVTSRYGAGYSTDNLLYNGGLIILPRGRWRIGNLRIDRNHLTLIGDSPGGTILETADDDLLTLGPSGPFRCYRLHIRDMTLASRTGGGHVIHCPTSMTGSLFEWLYIDQDNADKSWYAHDASATVDADTDAPILSWDYIGNVWRDCFLDHVSAQSVPGFDLYSNAINGNAWENLIPRTCGHYVFDLEAKSNFGNNNRIEGIVGEACNGGMVRLAGMRQTTLDNVVSNDLSATMSRHLIHLDVAASGASCSEVTVRKCQHFNGTYTLGAGVYDLYVDGPAVDGVYVEDCGQQSHAFTVNANHRRVVVYGDTFTTVINDSNTFYAAQNRSGAEGIQFGAEATFGPNRTTLSLAYALKTAGATLALTEQAIGADASGGSFTLFLPTAVGNSGKTFTVKKSDASGNAVTLDGNGAQTIDGALTYVLATQYEYVTIISNGANWLVIGND